MLTIPKQLIMSLLLIFVGSCSCGSKTVAPPLPNATGTGLEVAGCGNFEFVVHDIKDGYYTNGIDVGLSFGLDTGTCDCTSDSILFIQIVRTVSGSSKPVFSYPSRQKALRATDDGWYIDRIDGYRWGYIGMEDDGRPGRNVTTGSTSIRATLKDSPYRPDRKEFHNIRWEAVTAPVCVDRNGTNGSAGGPNVNRVLGLYYWTWEVSADGTVEHHYDLDGKAKSSLRATVSAAIKKWNCLSDAWCTQELPTYSSDLN